MTDKKTDIFQAARELFYTKGFKDTNISEIAKAAGIAVGTFYNYYPSKEELFLEVYFKENEIQKQHLLESANFNDSPAAMITKIVVQNAIEMNSNLILKEWYNKELFAKLEQLFHEQGGIGRFDEITHGRRIDMIKQWKAEGKIRADISDEMINAIFSAIPYIDIHKSEIGLEYFPQILIYITEFVMEGLTNCPK